MSDQGNRAARRKPGRQDWRLLFRFVLLNIIAIALVVAAEASGLITQAFNADSTNFVVVIVIIFIAGFALTIWRVIWTSREIERATYFNPDVSSCAASYVTRTTDKDAQSRNTLSQALRLELSQNITIIRHLASSLVFLGLIGTVIGFIIALSGVDPDQAVEADNIGPMVSALISGMSTALVTTLVGSLLNIWLMANYQLLSTGTVQLINTVVELGEHRAST